MKSLIKILIFFLTLIYSEQAFSATQTVIYRSGGGGSWWCLWCSNNFQSTYKSDSWGWDPVKKESIHYITISCTGDGSQQCPSAVITSGGVGGSPDTFIESSTQLMSEYVNSQGDLGIYSGYQSFDVYYDGQFYIRNVSWDGDILQGTVTMNIAPFNE